MIYVTYSFVVSKKLKVFELYVRWCCKKIFFVRSVLVRNRLKQCGKMLTSSMSKLTQQLSCKLVLASYLLFYDGMIDIGNWYSKQWNFKY